MNQTAPLKLPLGKCPDEFMQERFDTLKSTGRIGADLSEVQTARMGDACFIGKVDEDGNSYWHIGTISEWQELGGMNTRTGE